MTKTDNKKTGIKLKAVGVGVIVGVIIITLILFLGAVFISAEKLPESFGSTLICIATFLGTASGGFLAGKRNKGIFVITGIIVGLVILLLRMIVSAFSADGKIFDISSLKLMVFMLFGGIFGGLMAGKKRHKRKKR